MLRLSLDNLKILFVNLKEVHQYKLTRLKNCFLLEKIASSLNNTENFAPHIDSSKMLVQYSDY